MCYDLTFVEIKRMEWELKHSSDPAQRKQLQEQLKRLKEGFIFWTKGFSHPRVPVIYLEEGKAWLDMMHWGLIPRWSRDEKKALELWNKTLNARGEEMFEKPSYRASALDRRCLILATGFYEYHHQGSSTYPFYIHPKDEGPLYLGGLWDEATIDGHVYRTFTIVTVQANEIMVHIHNGPGNKGRMPLVVPEELHELWLKPLAKGDKRGLDRVKSEIIKPYEASLLNYYPVSRPTGKSGKGDNQAMHEEVEYPELELHID